MSSKWTAVLKHSQEAAIVTGTRRGTERRGAFVMSRWLEMRLPISYDARRITNQFHKLKHDCWLAQCLFFRICSPPIHVGDWTSNWQWGPSSDTRITVITMFTNSWFSYKIISILMNELTYLLLYNFCLSTVCIVQRNGCYIWILNIPI